MAQPVRKTVTGHYEGDASTQRSGLTQWITRWIIHQLWQSSAEATERDGISPSA